MIEQELEKAIIDAVAALGLDGVALTGAWQGAGEVKGVENASARAVCAVSVRPRTYETFTTPRADFAASLALAVRREMCPDGSALSGIADPILEMLDGWQRSIETLRGAVKVERLGICGLRLDGGEVAFDEGRGAWTVSQTFTIRGVVR